MAEFEFRVDEKALAVVKGSQISANFDECKAALTEMMMPYATMAVTEDGVSGAKADRAKIRKVKERLEDARKMVKKVYNEPLSAFETKCKELVSICDTAADNLDSQLKAFDEARKEAKLNALKEFFTEKAVEVSDFLKWEDVYDPRWGNVTYTEEQAHIDILSKVAGTSTSIAAIRGMNSPFETELLEEYRQTHDINAVMIRSNRLNELREKEQQRKAEQETKRQEKATMPHTHDNDTTAIPREAESVNVLDFRVWATNSQLQQLSAFLRENGIKYGRVPKGEA